MTWVKEYESPGKALRGLLLGFPRLLLKQLFDVTFGIIAIVAALTAAQFLVEITPGVTGSVYPEALVWLISTIATPGFVFYGTLAVLTWTYIIVTVAVPEEWGIFTDEEDIVGDASGFELEFRRVAHTLVGALYKGIVALLAAIPATMLLDSPISLAAPLWAIAIPLLELELARREITTPGVLMTLFGILLLSPLIYLSALAAFVIRRSPDAAREALDSLFSLLKLPLERRPENETLVDLVFNSGRRRSRNQ